MTMTNTGELKCKTAEHHCSLTLQRKSHLSVPSESAFREWGMEEAHGDMVQGPKSGAQTLCRLLWAIGQ